MREKNERRRTVRRNAIILAAVAWGSAWGPCAGAAPEFTLSARPLFGALYGTADEYVYNQDRTVDYKNSQLVWALQPVFFTGAALALDAPLGIFAELDVRQGLSGVAGEMTDSDFLNGDGVRTHFSQSDSMAERDTLMDLRAGWEYRGQSFRAGVFGAASYMDLKWSARDGYAQYPASGTPYATSPYTPGTYTPWSASETETPLYGTGILYESTYIGGSLGVRAAVSLSAAVSLTGSFSFTPILQCSTLDNHVERQLDFSSTMTGGYMIEPRVALAFSFLPSATLRLDMGYRSAWGLKGDLKQANTGESDFSTAVPYVAGPDSAVTAANGSGADFQALDASLGLSIAL